jgi:hypothetical protein
MALSEQGARRVGKDYEVEPFAVYGGCFHSKISVLTADDECHVLVGSGNLTFNGWGGNLEVVEHLHPSFATDAIEDAADFFASLATAGNVRHIAANRCVAIAESLRRSIQGKPRNGDIRLLHSLRVPISQSIAEMADGLGGATRIIAAAPFWDAGAAIDQFCKSLGLQEVFVHAHSGGTVEGRAGLNWPWRVETKINAVEVAILEEANPRRLHAKLFEVLCRRGRIVLSGSANATTAALTTTNNVEACVARLYRQRAVGWQFSPSKPPAISLLPSEELEQNASVSGILRASLEADKISGHIITPKMHGRVSVDQITTEGAVGLGNVELGEDECFRLLAPGLEAASWKGTRLVIQARDAEGRTAKGFVSIVAFAEISRRAGAFAPRLMAVIAGTETPADVAAIMTWFHDDPRRLTVMPARISSSGEEHDTNGHSRMIPISELSSSYTRHLHDVSTAHGTDSWRRFMEHVLASFREQRGPFGQTGAGRKSDDEADEELDQSAANTEDPAIRRSFEIFEKLFEVLLSTQNAPQFAIVAFDLTQYICERLQPDLPIAKAWLERLTNEIIRHGAPKDRTEDIAAALLVLLACEYDPARARATRSKLLRLGYPLSDQAPSEEHVKGFQSVLIQTASFADVWNAVGQIRTYREQARAYISALEAGTKSTEYGALIKMLPDEGSILEDAFTSSQARRKIELLKSWADTCPRCYRKLPILEVNKLRSLGVATAKNCCQRILFYLGD